MVSKMIRYKDAGRKIEYVFGKDHKTRTDLYGRSEYMETTFDCDIHNTYKLNKSKIFDLKQAFKKENKGREIEMIECIISAHPKELKGTHQQNVELMLEIARRNAEFLYPNSHYLISIQKDGKGGLYHAHIMFVNNDYISDKAISNKYRGTHYMSAIHQVCKQFEKDIEKWNTWENKVFDYQNPRHHLRKGRQIRRDKRTEYTIEDKPKQVMFGDYLRDKIDQVRFLSYTVEDYKKQLREYGIQTIDRTETIKFYSEEDRQDYINHNKIDPEVLEPKFNDKSKKTEYNIKVKRFKYQPTEELKTNENIKFATRAKGTVRDDTIGQDYTKESIIEIILNNQKAKQKRIEEEQKRLEEQKKKEVNTPKAVKQDPKPVTDQESVPKIKPKKKQDPPKVVKEPEKKNPPREIKQVVTPDTPPVAVAGVTTLQEMERKAREELEKFDILQDLNNTGVSKMPENRINTGFTGVENEKIKDDAEGLEVEEPVKKHTEEIKQAPKAENQVKQEQIPKVSDPVAVSKIPSQPKELTVDEMKKQLINWGCADGCVNGNTIIGINPYTDQQVRKAYEYLRDNEDLRGILEVKYKDEKRTQEFVTDYLKGIDPQTEVTKQIDRSIID